MEARYVRSATTPPVSIDYKDYYTSQVGGAIDPYVSYYHLPQRGRGFFGRVIKNSILPIIRSVLPYLKEKALDGAEGLISDMKDGMTIKEAGTKQLKRTGAALMDDVVAKIQRGRGVRRRRKRRTVTRKRKIHKSKRRVRRRTAKGRRRGRKKVVLFT